MSTETDRLTQLQDALDTLMTQMYASLHYLSTHHSYTSISSQTPYSQIPGVRTNPTVAESTPQSAIQPQSATHRSSIDAAVAPDTTAAPLQDQGRRMAEEGEEFTLNVRDPLPDPPGLFEARCQELAQDIVVKEQQVEALIASLPGIGVSSGMQEGRIRELEGELVRLEVEHRRAEKERDGVRARVEVVLMGVRRV
jgi:mediator of RNA polymerase II transcription subunit 21